MARRRGNRDERTLSEIRLLRADLRRLQAAAVGDRSWSHLGVELALFAIGLALATLPSAGATSEVEAIMLMGAGSASAVVTVVRWFNRRHPI